MLKTWGKEIWEKKAKFQIGQEVSGGVISLIRGRKSYIEHMKRIQNEISDFLEQHKEVKKILEIGPGPDAINAQLFLNKNYSLDLVDVSPTTLRKAKENIRDKNVELYEQDMIDLNLPKKYGLILCLGTFLHVSSHLALIVMNNFNSDLAEFFLVFTRFPPQK